MGERRRGRLDPAAEVGFGREAATYRSVRPSYPDAVLDTFVGLVPPPAVVCDLAAGTGIFTTLLVERGYDVTAVEPIAAMRDQLSDLLPDVAVVDATAEALPFDDGTFDAVAAAQAFHWFEPSVALPQIHRVLRPGGVLAMVWNVRDESVGWVHTITELVNARTGGRPYEDHRERPWAEVVAEAGGFTALESQRFANPVPATPASVVERVRSTSFVAALDPEPQADLVAEVAAIVADDPDLAGREQFTFPHDTVIHWCRRI